MNGVNPWAPPQFHPLTGRPVLGAGQGNVATEESITVTHPLLNGGLPTNIPSIWAGQRPPAQFGTPQFEDWAVERALQSGQQFQSFGNIAEAIKAAKERSEMLGRTMQMAPTQPPIFPGR